MKKIILIAIMLLMSVAIVNADTLKWDASTGVIDGYFVTYWETEFPANEYGLDVGSVTEVDVIELNLDPNVKYTIEVRAYNKAGHSKPSNQIEYTREDYVRPNRKADLPEVSGAPWQVRIDI